MAEQAFGTGPVDPDVVIRPIVESDLPALLALDAAVFDSLPFPEFVVRQLFDLHHECWLVAEDGRGLRGYTLAVPASDGSCGWVLGLAVLEEHRRKGCGRLLTQAAIDLLTKAGVPVAKLTVEPDNCAAIELYEAAGFRIDDPTVLVDYLGPGEDRIVMVARL
jgi:[ribosomal protein S18]-alanine N-acetyltransferase